MVDRLRVVARIRLLLALFAIGLALSGLTAFPLIHEVAFLDAQLGPGTSLGRALPNLANWIAKVDFGLRDTNRLYPFIQYGTDWLAFAHLVIATAFWGPFKEPVRNKWVVDFGIIACLAVFPLAFICGPIRGIPFYWRLIDCSFGVIGVLPLLLAKRAIGKLESATEP
ncbi:MAG: hypothetical protein JF616_00380 [Fibrobacteres bacterium]|nr:hypothetical protein [Fibrobacterota bacterium]